MRTQKGKRKGIAPWYYVSEVSYPFITPEYVFPEGSLQRWNGMAKE